MRAEKNSHGSGQSIARSTAKGRRMEFNPELIDFDRLDLPRDGRKIVVMIRPRESLSLENMARVRNSLASWMKNHGIMGLDVLIVPHEFDVLAVVGDKDAEPN